MKEIGINNKKLKKISKKIVVVLMVIALVIGMIPLSSVVSYAAENISQKKLEILISSDVGASVSTEKYKEDLLAELVSKGVKKDNVRFIDSIDTIKTSNLDMGWLVYDHIKYIEPYGGYTNKVYNEVTPESTAYAYNRYRHIYSLNGGKEMTFLGYSAPAYKDFAIYPSSSTDTKIVNFDISADKVDTHTLEGAGYLVNAGVDSNGILNAYLLFYRFTSSTSGNVYLMKVTQNAKAMNDSANGLMVNGFGVTVGTPQPFTIDSITKKINVNMVVSSSNIQCSYSKYTKDTSGTLVKGSETSLFNAQIATQNQTGFNGFGPLVSYTSHGCSSLTMFTFSNLSMKVNTSADNALKQTTWSSDESVAKFYVNITDKGLSTNDNVDKILTSIIDNSLYYIGAGTSTSKAKTDADYVGYITNGSKYIETTPGTQDAGAITDIADAIILRTGQPPVKPLQIKSISLDDKKTPNDKSDDTYKIEVDNIDGKTEPFNYEIVYDDIDNGLKKDEIEGIERPEDDTIIIDIPYIYMSKTDWIIIREKSDDNPVLPTPSKLLTTSDQVSPVVSFQILDELDNESTTYNMKDGSVTLHIKDNSYSNSFSDIGSNVTKTYTIIGPDGNLIGSNGTVTLTSANTFTGDYRFTTKISVTEDAVTTNYELTKKIAIFNDTTKPTVKIVSGPAKVSLTIPKTCTITMQDDESGLASYAIVLTKDATAPDTADLLKSISDIDSAYYEVPLVLPIDKSGTFNIFVVVTDKSGNKYNELIDSYTVSPTVAVIYGINQASDTATIEAIIIENSQLLNLNLTNYNLLKNKQPVLEALKSKGFTSLNSITSAFNNSVSIQKTIEDLANSKINAKAELQAALETYAESDYNAKDWTTLNNAKTNADTLIDSATTVNNISYYKTSALTSMNAVLTKVKYAINQVNNSYNYILMGTAISECHEILGLNLDVYNALDSSNKIKVQTALVSSRSYTSAAGVKTAFEAIVAQQKAIEDLTAAKVDAKFQLQTVLKGYIETEYSQENWSLLNKAKTDGDNAIEKSNAISDVSLAKTTAINAMDGVKTIKEEQSQVVDKINNATGSEEVAKEIQNNHELLKLDMTVYNALKDKGKVGTELLNKSFQDLNSFVTAFNYASVKAAADEKVKAELVAGILSVENDLIGKKLDTVTSDDKNMLNKNKDIIEKLLSQIKYLTEKQKDVLQSSNVLVDDCLQRINENEIKIKQIEDLIGAVNVDYTTDKTKKELLDTLSQISEVLKNEGNITNREKAKLLEEEETINKAIVVIDDREATKNLTKNSYVILTEDQIKQLPDPDTASDPVIFANSENIANAKISFEELGDKKVMVADNFVTKLDKLINRMSKIDVVVDSAVPNTKITASGLGLLVSKDDLNSGKNINVSMKIMEKSNNSEDDLLLITMATDRKVGASFDISIYKTVGDSDPIKLSELDTKVKITIEIPEEIRGKESYSIIRVHNGVPEFLEVIQEGNFLTFETDRFSTYAISYSEAKVDNAVEVSPKTGDLNVNSFGQYVILIILVSIVALYYVRKRQLKRI